MAAAVARVDRCKAEIKPHYLDRKVCRIGTGGCRCCSAGIGAAVCDPHRDRQDEDLEGSDALRINLQSLDK